MLSFSILKIYASGCDRSDEWEVMLFLGKCGDSKLSRSKPRGFIVVAPSCWNRWNQVSSSKISKDLLETVDWFALCNLYGFPLSSSTIIPLLKLLNTWLRAHIVHVHTWTPKCKKRVVCRRWIHLNEECDFHLDSNSQFTYITVNTETTLACLSLSFTLASFNPPPLR